MLRCGQAPRQGWGRTMQNWTPVKIAAQARSWVGPRREKKRSSWDGGNTVQPGWPGWEPGRGLWRGPTGLNSDCVPLLASRNKCQCPDWPTGITEPFAFFSVHSRSLASTPGQGIMASVTRTWPGCSGCVALRLIQNRVFQGWLGLCNIFPSSQEAVLVPASSCMAPSLVLVSTTSIPLRDPMLITMWNWLLPLAHWPGEKCGPGSRTSEPLLTDHRVQKDS